MHSGLVQTLSLLVKYWLVHMQTHMCIRQHLTSRLSVCMCLVIVIALCNFTLG